MPPTYSRMWIFGCVSYPYIGTTRKDKLSPKSQWCVFIGYSGVHCGYKHYNPITDFVSISCHMVLDEFFFPSAENKSLSSTTLPPSTVTLPIVQPCPSSSQTMIDIQHSNHYFFIIFIWILKRRLWVIFILMAPT